jgi:hypothetical protein
MIQTSDFVERGSDISIIQHCSSFLRHTKGVRIFITADYVGASLGRI